MENMSLIIFSFIIITIIIRKIHFGPGAISIELEFANGGLPFSIWDLN
jgi:hypothetical protein